MKKIKNANTKNTRYEMENLLLLETTHVFFMLKYLHQRSGF